MGSRFSVERAQFLPPRLKRALPRVCTSRGALFCSQRFASAIRRDRDHRPQQIGDRCPRDGNGSFVVPLPRDVLDKLNYLRGPGESYSDVILRVAKGERGDLMTTH